MNNKSERLKSPVFGDRRISIISDNSAGIPRPYRESIDHVSGSQTLTYAKRYGLRELKRAEISKGNPRVDLRPRTSRATIRNR